MLCYSLRVVVATRIAGHWSQGVLVIDSVPAEFVFCRTPPPAGLHAHTLQSSALGWDPALLGSAQLQAEGAAAGDLVATAPSL